MGPPYVILDGQSTVGVLIINTGVQATISGLTIQNGRPQAHQVSLAGGS
jgi:hypothetical protein